MYNQSTHTVLQSLGCSLELVDGNCDLPRNMHDPSNEQYALRHSGLWDFRFENILLHKIFHVHLDHKTHTYNLCDPLPCGQPHSMREGLRNRRTS